MLSRYRYVRGLVGGAAVLTALAAGAATQIHSAPAAAAVTPHRVLFDNTKAETAGNADWIISTSQPDPLAQNSTPTAETDWTGALSAWGVALQKTGALQPQDAAVGQHDHLRRQSGALDLTNFDDVRAARAEHPAHRRREDRDHARSCRTAAACS